MKHYTANTKMREIEKKYGLDFGVRADKRLGSFLRERGYPSLARLLRVPEEVLETKTPNLSVEP